MGTPMPKKLNGLLAPPTTSAATMNDVKTGAMMTTTAAVTTMTAAKTIAISGVMTA